MSRYVNRAHQAYRNNAVETQSSGMLVYLLYEGAVKFLDRADVAIQERRIADAHQNIMKTQNILYELINTLNLDAGNVASQLMSLYDYLLNRLIQANLKKDVEIIREVRFHFNELAQTWKAIL